MTNNGNNKANSGWYIEQFPNRKTRRLANKRRRRAARRAIWEESDPPKPMKEMD